MDLQILISIDEIVNLKLWIHTFHDSACTLYIKRNCPPTSLDCNWLHTQQNPFLFSTLLSVGRKRMDRSLFPPLFFFFSLSHSLSLLFPIWLSSYVHLHSHPEKKKRKMVEKKTHVGPFIINGPFWYAFFFTCAALAFVIYLFLPCYKFALLLFIMNFSLSIIEISSTRFKMFHDSTDNKL